MRAALGLIVSCALMPAAVIADPMRLPGHNAVYDLTLEHDAASTMSGASGRYVVALDDLCEGYTMNERLVVELVGAQGNVVTDYRFSAYESDNGDVFRFATETAFDGARAEESEGTLRVEGGTTEIDFAKAEDRSIDGVVLAPLSHIRSILRSARAGEGRHAAEIFDGDPKTPIFYAVTRMSEGETSDGVLAELDGLKTWQIDAVYFEADAGAEGDVPQFAFSGRLHDNGIITNLRLDYGDFVLNGELAELELSGSTCE